MKTKIIALLLALLMLLSLTACGGAAKEAEELIAAIGEEVTLESEGAIAAARAAFDALSEKQQEELVELHKELRRAEHALQQLKDQQFADEYLAVVDKVALYNDSILNETVVISEVWEHVGKDECLSYMEIFAALTCDEDFETVYGEEEADAKKALVIEGLFGDDASFDGYYYQAMAMVNWYGPIHQEGLVAAAEAKAEAAALREKYGESYPESLDLLESYIAFSDEYASATTDFSEVKSETAEEYAEFMQFFLSLLQEQEIACIESAI